MTRICVAIDSRNHVVLNSVRRGMEDEEQSAERQEIEQRRERPMIAVKRISARMSQTCGRAVASGRTESNGMPISEKS